MKHLRLVIQGSVAGLILGVAVAAAWSSRPYTSVAILTVVPQQIPASLVPADNISVQRTFTIITQTILSRGNLQNIINQNHLYTAERARMPMEDIVDKMRRAIRIDTEPSIQVSFSASDPIAAQKGAADIVSRVITEWVRNSATQAVLTRQFMQDSVGVAAKKWEESLARVRAAERTGESLERARLDANIARQRYENLSAKLADAEMLESMHRRQQGVTLELLDPPNLPSEWRPPIWLGALTGLATGAVLGFLISAIPSWRPAIRHGI